MTTQLATAAAKNASGRSKSSKALNGAGGASAGAADVERELLLASLLSSRICHDLVGPVGALGNGVEFLAAEDQSARDHAMRVITESTAQARARLQFYRAAFGYGGSLGDSVQQDEIKTLAQDFMSGGKAQLDWRTTDRALPRLLTRLVLNLVLIGYESLPRGGLMRVGIVEKTERQALVAAEGAKIIFNERAQMLLSEGVLPPAAEPIQPKEAPLLLTHRLALEANASVRFALEEGRLVIAATF